VPASFEPRPHLASLVLAHISLHPELDGHLGVIQTTSDWFYGMLLVLLGVLDINQAHVLRLEALRLALDPTLGILGSLGGGGALFMADGGAEGGLGLVGGGDAGPGDGVACGDLGVGQGALLGWAAACRGLVVGQDAHLGWAAAWLVGHGAWLGALFGGWDAACLGVLGVDGLHGSSDLGMLFGGRDGQRAAVGSCASISGQGGLGVFFGGLDGQGPAGGAVGGLGLVGGQGDVLVALGARGGVGAAAGGRGVLGLVGGAGSWATVVWATLLGLVWTLCGAVEGSRVPVDLPECESELVSGYVTEVAGLA
jgi:hypothetical protein